MENFGEIFMKCSLFEGIESQNLLAMMYCIDAKLQYYKKNELIFMEGDPATHIGLVLSGAVQIVREDYYGNRSIVAAIEPAHLFGETFACADLAKLPVNVIAVKDSAVLLMDCHQLTTSCCNACAFHAQMIFNLMKVMAKKNLLFNEKIQITSKRTTREKLLTFLSLQAQKYNSDHFEIPYNRQELADYLEVDRSGLSVEISKLCNDGIIQADKKHFQIIQKDCAM